MTHPDAFLPRPINLAAGIVARIDLSPMPQADSHGRYQRRQDREVHVSLFRAGELIERRRWDTVICGLTAMLKFAEARYRLGVRDDRN